MKLIIEVLFFLSIFLCFSAYLFYPLVIMFIAKFFPFSPVKKDSEPSVSILISAYNEEKHIEQKLINTLELDYPQEKVEILVGSDGSSDRTVEIAKEFSENSSKNSIKVIDYMKNRGKTSVQNDLVENSNNEILVFSDAASFLRRDSLKNLIRAFSDQRVGAIAGCMAFIDEDHNLTTKGQGVYWRYEMKLREIESSLGRMVGVDGPLYAVRRENYVPLSAHIISDLMTPLMVLKQNKKVVLEKEAVVLEEPTKRCGQELNTRRRITLRGLVGLFSDPELLSPFHFPFLSLQIFFHKLLRWFVGPLVVVNLVCCVFLSSNSFFSTFLGLHVIFYLLALLGFIFDKIGWSITILRVPYYFCLVNIAACLGIFDFFRKKQAVSWNPVRQ